MDIVARTMLNFVQEQEGYANAVIAGGSVRDYLLSGGKPYDSRDYDIFIPSTTNEQFSLLKKKLADLVKVENKSRDDYPASQFQVSGFKFKDKTFDLIKRRDIPDGILFGENLIDTFNFGINMAYFDGTSISTNDKFNEDLNGYYATLYNVRNDQEFLKSIEKYQDLSKKWGLMFRQKIFNYDNKKDNMYGY